MQIGFDLDKGIEFQDNSFDIQRKLTAEEISSYELFLGGQRYMSIDTDSHGWAFHNKERLYCIWAGNVLEPWRFKMDRNTTLTIGGSLDSNPKGIDLHDSSVFMLPRSGMFCWKSPEQCMRTMWKHPLCWKTAAEYQETEEYRKTIEYLNSETYRSMRGLKS